MVEVKTQLYLSLGRVSLTLSFLLCSLAGSHGLQGRKGKLGVFKQLYDCISTSQLKTAFMPLHYLN